jgi:hypothetical protein
LATKSGWFSGRANQLALHAEACEIDA